MKIRKIQCVTLKKNVFYELAISHADLLARNNKSYKLRSPSYDRSDREEIPPGISKKLFVLRFLNIYERHDFVEGQKNFHDC